MVCGRLFRQHFFLGFYLDAVKHDDRLVLALICFRCLIGINLIDSYKISTVISRFFKLKKITEKLGVWCKRQVSPKNISIQSSTETHLHKYLKRAKQAGLHQKYCIFYAGNMRKLRDLQQNPNHRIRFLIRRKFPDNLSCSAMIFHVIFIEIKTENTPYNNCSTSFQVFIHYNLKFSNHKKTTFFSTCEFFTLFSMFRASSSFTTMIST